MFSQQIVLIVLRRGTRETSGREGEKEVVLISMIENAENDKENVILILLC